MPISNTNSSKKQYATDEAGMLQDAKQYAKRDYDQTLAIIQEINGIPEDDAEKEIQQNEVADTLIAFKYRQIKNSRLNRNTKFD